MSYVFSSQPTILMVCYNSANEKIKLLWNHLGAGFSAAAWLLIDFGVSSGFSSCSDNGGGFGSGSCGSSGNVSAFLCNFFLYFLLFSPHLLFLHQYSLIVSSTVQMPLDTINGLSIIWLLPIFSFLKSSMCFLVSIQVLDQCLQSSGLNFQD